MIWHDRAGAQAGRSIFLHDHTFGVVDPAIQVRPRKVSLHGVEVVAPKEELSRVPAGRPASSSWTHTRTRGVPA